VTFKITHHSGFAAPADALDLLWLRLDCNRDGVVRDDDGVQFAKVDAELRATWREDAPLSMERPEREEFGRRAVLSILCEVCKRAPELESDWYAVCKPH
jgi:hypothetical protein